MLRQLSILLILLLVLSCKEDSADVSPDMYMDSVSGQWNLFQQEKGTYGKKYWENVQATSKDHLIILDKGNIVGLDSMAICCAPNFLQINKTLVEIKANPQVTLNPQCALVQCASCSTWDLELVKNTLIITYCDGTRLKYIRP